MDSSNLSELEQLVRRQLELVGEDPSRDGLLRTPLRVAKSFEYLTSGYKSDLKKVLNNALFDSKSEDMVLVKDIDFFSLCEHHMLPFFGKCHIGYLPKGKVIGISKLPRIVEVYARRLQVQERMTHEIATTVQELIGCDGVGVVTEGQHLCMMMRGVEKQNSYTMCSSLLGRFRDDARTRGEFLNLIHHRRS
ncbi:MAG: folE [Verrucomicrobiales bacterium]|nr:folE [Verrucomicrobiales bacterium]